MIVIIQCRDQIGLVADISRLLAEVGLNIVSMRGVCRKSREQIFYAIGG